MKQILNSKIFRYFISAGLATVVDILVYFIAYNYIYQKQDIHLFNIAVIAASSASLILSYTCGLLTNFTISKILVFHESDLETHKQLFRYILVALGILFLNYLMMKFLIRDLGWYPTFSRAFSALSIGVLSFTVHKYFSFRVSKTTEKETKGSL